jgi:hypothetical protein
MRAFAREFLGDASIRRRFVDVELAPFRKSCLEDVYECPLAKDRLAAIAQLVSQAKL